MSQQQFELIERVEGILPGIAEDAHNDALDTVIVHQDAFAPEESSLLGEAIQYLGIRGKQVLIICRS